MTIKNCLLTLALCVAATNLNAQTQQLRDNIFSKKLGNGLTVLVIEDNSVPLATINLTFKNGAFTESAAINGIAAVYHNMLLKGNKDYGNSDQAGFRSSQLGMLKASSVAEERAFCNIIMPSMLIDEGLKYMNSAIRYPVLDEQEMERGKSVADRELQVKESNALFLLNKTTGQHLWGDLSNRKMAIGSHESLKGITLALIDSVRNQYYYPNNALLTVAGRVEHDKIFNKVEELYGSWQPLGTDPFKKWPLPAFKPITKTDYFTVESSTADVPFILLSWQGPKANSDVAATYAADVFSYILTQNSSKLNKALVQSGLALQVDFNYLTLSQGGPITFFIKPNPQKIKECLAEVKKQIALFDTEDYVTAEQIATAQRKLEITKVRQEEVTSDFVNTLSFWWASASLDYFFTYINNLQKVKKVNLQSYVRKYIKNKPYCAGLLISPALRTQLKTDEFFKATN
jgi:zinc protease